jgi:signal recognition particle subunit SRP54
MMVSVDVYRPAAREQLRVIAREIGQPIYEGAPEEKLPLELAPRRAAKRQQRPRRAAGGYRRPPAHRRPADGRAEQLKEQLNPVEILFVADAMTGQDAVKSADEFHKRLGITGVILTKMDGDARGGAALSIRTSPASR